MTSPAGDFGDKAREEAGQPAPSEQAVTQNWPHSAADPYEPREPPAPPPVSGYPPQAYPPPAYSQPTSPPPGMPPTGYPPAGGHAWQGNAPPPVDPQQPVGYPEYVPGYPPPPFYPPPYQAGPPGYPGFPGYTDSYDPYQATRSRTNGLAIGSLVASIGGFPLLLLCYLGVASWVVGIVLGIVALNQIKQTNQEGRGMAIAGIAVGAVALVLSAIAAMVFVAATSTSPS